MRSPPWIRPNGLADLTLSSAMQRHILFVLDYTEGDVRWAAQELGIHQSTLWRWRNAMKNGQPRRLHRERRER